MLNPCNEAALKSTVLQIIRGLDLNEVIDYLVKDIISITEMETINADLRYHHRIQANRYLVCCLYRKTDNQFLKFVEILCEMSADIGEALRQAIKEHENEPPREEPAASDIDVQSIWGLSEQDDSEDPSIVAVLEQDNEELKRDLQDVQARLDASRIEIRRLKSELEQDNEKYQHKLQKVKSKLEQDKEKLLRELQNVKSRLDINLPPPTQRMVEKAGQPDPRGWGTISLCTPSGYRSCRIIDDDIAHKRWSDILHGVEDNCAIHPPPFLLPASMGGWMVYAHYKRVRANGNNLSVCFGLRNDPYNETVQPFRARIAFRVFKAPNGQLLFSGEKVGQFDKLSYGPIVAEVPIADFDINTLPYMDCTICKE